MEDENAKIEEILSIMSLIPNTFDPSSYFYIPKSQSNSDKVKNSAKLYFFKGMICFYRKHYFSYHRDFRSELPGDSWYLYDDNIVRKIGDWDDVLTQCIDGEYRPVLLIFE